MGQAQARSPKPPRRRAERLEAPITAEQKALIEHAAALQGRSITDFVLTSVQDAPRRAIGEHEIVSLSVRDSQAFVEALLNPPEPRARLREAAARYQVFIGRQLTYRGGAAPAIEALDVARHNRRGFRCGIETFDRHLRAQARRGRRRLAADRRPPPQPAKRDSLDGDPGGR